MENANASATGGRDVKPNVEPTASFEAERIVDLRDPKNREPTVSVKESEIEQVTPLAGAPTCTDRSGHDDDPAVSPDAPEGVRDPKTQDVESEQPVPVDGTSTEGDNPGQPNGTASSTRPAHGTGTPAELADRVNGANELEASFNGPSNGAAPVEPVTTVEQQITALWRALGERTDDLSLLGSRLDRLQTGSEEKEETGGPTQQPTANTTEGQRLRPTSKLAYMTLEEFRKRKFTFSKPHSSIDVITSGSTSVSVLATDAQTTDGMPAIPASLTAGHETVRCIQINSEALTAALDDTTTSSLFICAPFKSLIYKEPELRRRLDALTRKWTLDEAREVTDPQAEAAASPAEERAHAGENSAMRSGSQQAQDPSKETQNGQHSIPLPREQGKDRRISEEDLNTGSGPVSSKAQHGQSDAVTECEPPVSISTPAVINGAPLEQDAILPADADRCSTTVHEAESDEHATEQTQVPDAQTAEDLTAPEVSRESARPSEDANVVTDEDKSADSRQAYEDLKCLMHFYDECVKPRWTLLTGCDVKRVRFGDLWALFQPGDHVFMPGSTQKVWRVVKITGGMPLLDHLFSDDYGRSEAAEPAAVGGADLGPESKASQTQETETTSKSSSKYSADRTKWSPFVIDGYYLDYNGKEFGAVPIQCTINYFAGARDVRSLVASRKDVRSLITYPLRFVDDKKRSETVKNGRRFLELSRTKLRYYGGRSLTTGPDGRLLQKAVDFSLGGLWYAGSSQIRSEDVSSQVMIDFEKAFQYNPSWAPKFGLTEFALANDKETDVDIMTKILPDESHRWCMQNIDWYDAERTNEYRIKDEWVQSFGDTTTDDRDRFSEDDHVVLLPDRVFGFVLRTRSWACFDMREEYLHDVKSDESGWAELQLPSGHKYTLEALIERHVRYHSTKESQQSHETMDFSFVQGKGKGLVVLLHGLPGVGKTSTAETIAQKYRRPLLPITCGNLGLDSVSVEESLTENFALAQAWDCIVLLDEADVFLAARSKTDLQRNAVVSVFLRTLEYYTGILFLTTNRPGTFDEAFGSRIHMALYYPALSREATESIWEASLARLCKHYEKKDRTLTIKNEENEIIRFAQVHYDAMPHAGRSFWNGRQIRNAFQTALSLAEFDARDRSAPAVLDWRHFRTVALAVDDFEVYLQDSRGGFSDAELAYQTGLRADRFPPGFDDTAASRINKQQVPIADSQRIIRSLSPNSIITNQTNFSPPNPFHTPPTGLQRQPTLNQRLNRQQGVPPTTSNGDVETLLSRDAQQSGLSSGYGTAPQAARELPNPVDYHSQAATAPPSLQYVPTGNAVYANPPPSRPIFLPQYGAHDSAFSQYANTPYGVHSGTHMNAPNAQYPAQQQYHHQPASVSAPQVYGANPAMDPSQASPGAQM